MPLRTEVFIALRYLRPKRTDSFITVIGVLSLIGIALGVATLIIVMSVMNGFRVELLSHIIGLNGHISIYRPAQNINNKQQYVAELSKISGVVSVVPQIEKQVLMQFRKSARGVIIRGIDVNDLKYRPSLIKNLSADDIKRFKNGQVLIGVDLADNYGIGIGDQVRFLSPTVSKTPFGLVPRAMTFTVGGIFNAGLQQYDNNYVFLPLDKTQLFFNYNAAVDTLEVTINNINDIKGIQNNIASALPPFWVARNWQQMNAGFFNALEVERTVMFFILTLITIIATFIIIATLFMLVKAKSRDIGILRTIGLTPSGIMRIFMMTGSTIGLAGTALGFALGLVFSNNIEAIRDFLQSVLKTDLFSKDVYFLSKITAIIDWTEVGFVVTIAVLFSFLATLYPSRRASRLDPVEVIRNE